MGTICHDILEILANPRHRPIFDFCLSKNDIYAHPPIRRLIRRKILKTHTLYPEDSVFDKLNAMILVGMRSDFWVEGGEIIAHEYLFQITNKEPYFRIKGFFDKVAIKGDYVIIHDYKSSKRIFEGDDKESNTQALIYSVAAKKIWPNKKPKVIFIFLQHPQNPLLECEFNDDVLKGYETYLSLQQEKLDGFVHKNAFSHFAAHEEPPAEGGFKGKLLCGIGCKYEGHLKKDGTPHWHCAYRFPFTYYEIVKDGKVIGSIREDALLKVGRRDGVKYVKKRFDGCPAHVSVIL
jgi:hypothetical protein